MPLSVDQIKIGYKYKTPKNQERVVLGIEDDKVVYASRGGNVRNKWKNQRNKSSFDNFAKACDEKLCKLKKADFNKIKNDNNY
jgi:hypothetical protein